MHLNSNSLDYGSAQLTASTNQLDRCFLTVQQAIQHYWPSLCVTLNLWASSWDQMCPRKRWFNALAAVLWKQGRNTLSAVNALVLAGVVHLLHRSYNGAVDLYWKQHWKHGDVSAVAEQCLHRAQPCSASGTAPAGRRRLRVLSLGGDVDMTAEPS